MFLSEIQAYAIATKRGIGARHHTNNLTKEHQMLSSEQIQEMLEAAKPSIIESIKADVKQCISWEVPDYFYPDGEQTVAQKIAANAYAVADAMLAERAK